MTRAVPTDPPARAEGRGQSFRRIFASARDYEPVRAFVIFGALLVGLLGIFYTLGYRQLSLEVLRENLDLSRRAALQIARDVAEIGRRDDQAIDYDLLRRSLGQVRRVIEERIATQYFIREVEVRDRYDVRLALVSGKAPPAESPAARALPVDWSTLKQKTIRVPLFSTGLRSEGEVLLDFAPQALEQEVVDRVESLRVKTWIAGAASLGLLVLGLFYVVYLIRKNRRLEQSKQAAERASYVGLLASGLAHEIRNPLNAMNMNLQMLEEELAISDPEQAELLDSTKSEIKRLERLVNNFLTYARPARPRFEAKDLNEVARDVVRLLGADFAQHGVELVTALEPLLPRAEIDETQFKQALINLLVNARQVQPNGGTVTIRTRAGSKGDVVLEVEDQGPGIPDEVRERMFEVFYSSRGGGTGLGLPIAKQIVERHLGTIEIDTELGRGTTFRIRIPRHHGVAGATRAESGRPA